MRPQLPARKAGSLLAAPQDVASKTPLLRTNVHLSAAQQREQQPCSTAAAASSQQPAAACSKRFGTRSSKVGSEGVIIGCNRQKKYRARDDSTSTQTTYSEREVEGCGLTGVRALCYISIAEELPVHPRCSYARLMKHAPRPARGTTQTQPRREEGASVFSTGPS